MDPTTVAAGLAAALAAAAAGTAAAGVASARRHRLRASRAEAEVARLRRELQAERHAAGHDPLTGLPNRRTFYESGSPLVADTARRPLVAVLVDLDDFKRVNDTLGHGVGDHVLVEVARRFADMAGGSLVARFGGDEFVGLLEWPTGDDGWLRESAVLLAAELAAPVNVAGRAVAVTASVGLAPVRGAANIDDVLSWADAAMYQAKTMPGRAYVAGLSYLTDMTDLSNVPDVSELAGRHAEPAWQVPEQRTGFAWLPEEDPGPDVHFRGMHTAGPISR